MVIQAQINRRNNHVGEREQSAVTGAEMHSPRCRGRLGRRQARGGGGAARHGVRGRDDRLEYANWWNNNGILCLQIESLTAVKDAAQLAKAGVDCLTWGPADLSFDLEAHPEHPFQTVDDCLVNVLKQLEDTEVRVSFRTGTPDQRDKYLEMGVTVFMERPRTT